MSAEIPQIQGLEHLACYEDKTFNPYKIIKEHIIDGLPRAVLRVELEEAIKHSREDAESYVNLAHAFQELNNQLRTQNEEEAHQRKKIQELFNEHNKNKNTESKNKREKSLAKAYNNLAELLPSRRLKLTEAIQKKVSKINENIDLIKDTRIPSEELSKQVKYLNMGLQEIYTETNVLRNSLALTETYKSVDKVQKLLFPGTTRPYSTIKEYGDTTRRFINSFFSLCDLSQYFLGVEYTYEYKEFYKIKDISRKIKKKRKWR